MTDGISPKQFHESEGVEDWRVIGDSACVYFQTGSFAASARLVQAISEPPGVEDHKPDVPFWCAALGYEPRRDSPAEDLVDPHGRGAGFWFEQTKKPRADGGGAIHVAVWVPYDRHHARPRRSFPV